MKKRKKHEGKDRNSWVPFRGLVYSRVASPDVPHGNAFATSVAESGQVAYSLRDLRQVLENEKREKRDHRLDVRVTRSAKEILEKEARYRGLTLSGYLIDVAMRDALAGLERRAVLFLSERDSRLLLTALENPREPNDALIKAVENHGQDVEELV